MVTFFFLKLKKVKESLGILAYVLKLIKNCEKDFHINNYEIFFQSNLNYIKRIFDEEMEILINKKQLEILPSDRDFIELMFQISEHIFGSKILFEYISDRFLINLIKFLIHFVDSNPLMLTNVSILLFLFDLILFS